MPAKARARQGGETPSRHRAALATVTSGLADLARRDSMDRGSRHTSPPGVANLTPLSFGPGAVDWGSSGAVPEGSCAGEDSCAGGRGDRQCVREEAAARGARRGPARAPPERRSPRCGRAGTARSRRTCASSTGCRCSSSSPTGGECFSAPGASCGLGVTAEPPPRKCAPWPTGCWRNFTASGVPHPTSSTAGHPGLNGELVLGSDIRSPYRTGPWALLRSRRARETRHGGRELPGPDLRR